jgi:phenylpyruvate tautomerase PptA (4-oxalocrotonate tautomerase family)
LPFVRISLLDDTPPQARREIGEAVHAALVAVANVPEAERFQVIEPRAAEDLVFHRSFGGAARERVVFVELTLVRELSEEAKRRLYAELSARLTEAGVRADDLFVVLRENTLADWSQARGEATLLQTTEGK